MRLGRNAQLPLLSIFMLLQMLSDTQTPALHGGERFAMKITVDSNLRGHQYMGVISIQIEVSL